MTPGSAKASAEIRERIVRLRDEGLEFREIAEQVGRDVAVVWRHYRNAMRPIPAAAVAEHTEKCARRLDEQLRRIDMEREVLEDIVFGCHVHVSNGIVVRPLLGRDENGERIYGEPLKDPSPVMKAIDGLRALDDQEAKLLGLYPKQAITVERTTSELDAAVIAIIEQAKQRAAERTAARKAAEK